MQCECPQLKSLNLCSSKLRSLNLGQTLNIETLNLECSESLVKLDMPCDYPQLKYLNLRCPNLRYFNLGLTPNIEAFSSFIINRIIVCNPGLKHEEREVEFDMSLECPQLESLELFIPNLWALDLGSTPNLQTLKLGGCYSLVELHIHDECCKLKTLCLPCQHLRIFDFGLTQNVEALTLDGNDGLVERFIPVRCPQLECLELIESKLRTFELIPNLKTLILRDCDLVDFHVPDGDVKVESLAIKRCSKLKTLNLGRSPNLESLCLEDCSSLVKLHAPVGGVKLLIKLKGHLSTESVDKRTLQLDSSLPKFEFECSYKEDLPSSIRNVEKLISEVFFGRICGLQRLTKLKLEGNISELPKDIDRLQCLEQLTLWSTKIKRLPDSICRLKHLKSLELLYCKLLEKLPEDLGRLECLETLKLQGCIVLRDIPHNICRMTSLRVLSLYECNRVEELPEELGRLESELHEEARDKTYEVWNPFKSKLAAVVLNDFDFCIVTVEPFLAFRSCDDREAIKFNTQGVVEERETRGPGFFKPAGCRPSGPIRFTWVCPDYILAVEAQDSNPVDLANKGSKMLTHDPSSFPSMASSSTSSIQRTSFKYDVFLSFRGEDTRTNFVDHLYHALKRENIETYKDDKNLERGKKIGKELIEAIEDSRFHVIVFSKNYASSSWCLDELVKIMECQKTPTQHNVYPIFYHVEPTRVRKQIGEFGKAFAKHENDEAAKKWKEALIEATSLSGWDLGTIADGHEAEFIKRVVKDISSKLPTIYVDGNLIGMRTRINVVVSSLRTFPDEIMIGITGMGGIGKTTLARAVFDHIRKEFEGSSFIENVRESSDSPSVGLKSLQQQLLRNVLNRQDNIVDGVSQGKEMMKKYMPSRKVLVVLDDVDHKDQLEALAGEPNWFKSGSKIIITTRDRKVLETHRVKRIHEASLLTNEEAICLFSSRAFEKEIPSPRYEKLSTKVVSYAAGLPLTITVLGSTLYGENEHVWMDTLKELEKVPLDGSLQRLEVSYKGLDTNCQKIFLDVACILKGWKNEKTITVLESCGFHAIRGFSVLEKKSLITISHDKKLGMHDRIEDLGKHIVRRSHDPSQHSRLWITKEIIDILVNNRGTEATECIKLTSWLSSDIKPNTIMKGLGKMRKLRFLFVKILEFNCLELDEASQFPNSLQYLQWYRYPFRSLPGSFQASNLVVLKMPKSQIEQLWEEGERKVLDKLRVLKLSGASKLRTFDILVGLTPNLEILDLQRCYNLVKLDIPVGYQKLKCLKLSGSKLSTLDLLLIPNIETLILDHCVDLKELHVPRKCRQLKTLNLEGCWNLENFDMVRECPQLETLNLARCRVLKEFVMPWECPQLITLNLRDCCSLRKLGMPWVCPRLITLNLMDCSGLIKLDMPQKCPQLMTLNISFCENLEKLYIPRECLELRRLDAEHGCEKLLELHMPDTCPQLEELSIKECKNIDELVMPREYPQLEFLNMCCREFRSRINFNDLVLPKLGYLKLVYSMSRTLVLTSNLIRVTLERCDLEELHIPDKDVKLKELYIRNCLKLKTLDLTRTPNLQTLELEACYDLVKLQAPVGGLEKLIHLNKFRVNNLDIMDGYGISPRFDMSETSIDLRRYKRNNNSSLINA
ncbi:hypothetical protein OSB04_015621 [Centaurea solstitialis]|uniref:TIR domain-containing protein n=1 Tax=Centaurea solstitialis TaxID=347529 RepID=A0AA38TAJ1_9ASTR|nr:hypothetical protein OSB04_015621 [Centaurea solstitialis]